MPNSVTRPMAASVHRVGLALLLGCGLLLHLLQIDAPFGFGEGNAGSYFGCVAKGYREVGFLTVRGAPFVRDLYGNLGPYLHHPPGGFWLSAALGPAEWQLRATTLIAHLLALCALVALATPVLGRLRGLLAGALFLVVPAFYVDISASQWPFTIAAGLWLLLAFTRQHGAPAPGTWRVVALLAAAVGPWVDWHFGFFVLALIPLALPWRGCVRRLAAPWLVSAASLAAFLWWRQWAAQAPVWHTPGAGIENAGLVSSTILSRPPLLDQLAGMFRCSLLALTAPLVLGAVGGLAWLVARAPRLAAALLIAGLLGSLLFGHHVQTHTDFPSMLAPFAAVSTAALFAPARALTVVPLALLVLGTAQALQRVRGARTTFFRDYGRAATAATRERRADGSERRFVVASDMTWAYRYYVDSSDFLSLPVLDPAVLEANRAAITRQNKGVRYLALRYGGEVGAGYPRHPALEAYLDQFPATRLAELERAFAADGRDGALRVERALLVTIEP